jgi:hypothetical protein
MKFSAAVLASLGLYNAASAYQMYNRIPSSQSAPCPGLNTLANHGYIPAQGITRDALVGALTSVYNLDSNLAGTLTDGAISDFGVTNANGDTVFNLVDLRQHNVLEHDASLTRQDSGDAAGDNWSPQPDLIAQMMSLSQDGTSLCWCDFAKARLLRMNQESASDGTYSLTTKQSAIAYGEASVALEVFGNGKNMSLAFFESFFAQEKIPAGWKAPATAYTETQAGLDVAYIKMLTLDPNCQP